jgi:hypothetical protein
MKNMSPRIVTGLVLAVSAAVALATDVGGEITNMDTEASVNCAPEQPYPYECYFDYYSAQVNNWMNSASNAETNYNWYNAQGLCGSYPATCTYWADEWYQRSQVLEYAIGMKTWAADMLMS